ncbi:hypothetical protein ESCAB7627_2699 [Escherichia albertii TW07627]|uniref:Replication protein RepA n=1 Tax=Escherichia albertii (strain TW07627) TaxID=502347 RepID=A0ABC9NNH9_ESCAT|nr:hypothetical protein ESCAB7627_2699 [Escherichia albertii TW07627]
MPGCYSFLSQQRHSDGAFSFANPLPAQLSGKTISQRHACG